MQNYNRLVAKSKANTILRRTILESATAIPLWLYFVLFPAILARLIIAWLPSDKLMVTVPDDGYYYFTIARHIARGYGITFDGLAPTNGFHPLWMALITPIWWLVESSVTVPINLTLTLGAAIDVITMLGMLHLARFLTKNNLIAGLAVIAYAWNPYNLAASVNGLETSLSAMLFMWSLGLYWRLRFKPRPEVRHWLKLSTLWALLLLARTDYLVILFPCALDLMWKQRHNLNKAWIGFSAAILWAPWVIWNFLTFGTITQVSGKAYPYYLHAIWQAEHHSSREWLFTEARMAYGIIANLARFSGFGKSIILLVVAVVSLVAHIWWRRNRVQQIDLADTQWEIIQALLWPTLGAIGLLFYHGLVRWMYIPWYFVPSVILFILWFSLLLNEIAQRAHPRWSVVIVILFLIFQVFQSMKLIREGGMWPQQAHFFEVALPELTKECEQFGVVGLSDAGIAGYYLPCRVVNLDGVVNNEAFAAIREGRFRAYLDKLGIGRVHLNHIIRDVVAIKEGPIPDEPPFASQSR